MLRSPIFVIAIIGFTFGLGVACTKKAAPPPVAQQAAPAPVLKAAEQLTGAPAVLAALEKKDYDAVLGGLIQVGQDAKTDQDKVSFLVLKREVQMKLAGPAQTDPKAAQALLTLQAMTTGR